MESTARLAEQAKTGDTDAFSEIVLIFYPAIKNWILRSLRNIDEAEEAVQEVFIKAFLNIRFLRDPNALAPWLYGIARNEVNRNIRKLRRDLTLPIDESVIPAAVSDAAENPEKRTALLEAIKRLPPDLSDVIRLKYFTGLSMKETAVLLGLPEGRIKSRLYEARKKLRENAHRLLDSVDIFSKTNTARRRNIMQNVELVKKGAHVLARLSLKDQAALCTEIDNGTKFSPALLKSIGEISQGKDFVHITEGKLTLKEFIDILNYGDRFTEERLIKELDRQNPDLSEKIKRNMFVFEDFILFDRSALKKMLDRADPGTLQTALSDCSKKVRDHILSPLPPDEQKQWMKKIFQVDSRGPAVNQAQYDIIEIAKQLDQEGLIHARRIEDDGTPTFTFSAAE